MNFAKGAIIFVVGAAVGAAAGYIYASRVISKRADDDIKTLREYYEKKDTVKQENPMPLPVEEDISFEKPQEIEVEAEEQDDLVEEEYKDYTSYAKECKIDKTTMGASPFEYLSDIEFVQSDRQKIALDYYEGDGVLVNPDNPSDDMYEDIESTIGTDALRHFGDYEFDFVFVRNNRLSIDFEVCRHKESWASKAGLENEGPQDG